MTTGPQALEGGDYRVDWSTAGDCYYGADLEMEGESETLFSADGVFAGENFVYEIPAGQWRADVITGPSPGCGWSATLTKIA